MTIQQAIEKAGPGGKITNGNITLRIPIKPHSRIKEVYDSEGNEVDWSVVWPKHLTGENWQVIEPEAIKEGDIVSAKGCVGNECRITGHGAGVYTMQCISGRNIKDGPCACMNNLSTLTLIRKGRPKHEEITSSYSYGKGNQRVHIDLGPGYKPGDCFKVTAVRSTCEGLEDEPKVGTERGWHDA